MKRREGRSEVVKEGGSEEERGKERGGEERGRREAVKRRGEGARW